MKDPDKIHPRYDDHAHIDSAAIDYPPKPKEDYTAQYLAPLQSESASAPES